MNIYFRHQGWVRGQERAQAHMVCNIQWPGMKGCKVKLQGHPHAVNPPTRFRFAPNFSELGRLIVSAPLLNLDASPDCWKASSVPVDHGVSTKTSIVPALAARTRRPQRYSSTVSSETARHEVDKQESRTETLPRVCLQLISHFHRESTRAPISHAGRNLRGVIWTGLRRVAGT